jgi:hypothetical protein
MFKRIEKKIKKKQEEEELGLDEDMKDVLGLNDTDSDESSDSESDEDGSDSANENDDDDVEMGNRGDYVNSGDEGASVEEDESEDEAEDGSDDDEEDGYPNITIAQALLDPLYVPSKSQPESKSCVACPHKVLRAPQQPSHLASQVC